ncbi:hypothetical protein TTHERM_00927140 (macronuclear) [Tetrahymena thermophila SB210]|uniref:Uncharacterized protein n=1 Tax=Tetrahymena thermophila (strain SB210) TaxID=312017 RepID=Q22DU6_TETTS|nr:hypothetical protein TTHERM_00927140 [Tetrahymena thermophila SB210]EAR83459.2 hypothetical protein TTHERM_00927140 [Tetrahymena thermophila SB210]|eukprot:XP_001031122.2 hypothetical protein TTHERM_00927140 [Tetrahymena thermophila SB210]
MKIKILKYILTHMTMYFIIKQCVWLYNSQIRMPFKEQMELLSNYLSENRYKESKPFQIFPFQFNQEKGLYASYVILNIMDKRNSYIDHLVRTQIGIDDNNYFVTNCVLLNLLDCVNLGTYEFNENELEETIDTLLEFKDKNRGNIPSATFYKQIFVKETNTWSQYGTNLLKVSDFTKLFPDILRKFLNYIGLSFINLLQRLSTILHLPTDSDDGSQNQVLGIQLMTSPKIKQSIKDKWLSKNYKFKEYFDLLKRYSYYPLDKSNSSSSMIDPRSYFAFHEYLEKLPQMNITQFGLFTTWLLNIEDQVEGVVQIPFNVNLIDLTVMNNIIFSLNQLIIYGNQTMIDQVFDDTLTMLYLNSTSFLAAQAYSGVIDKHIDISNPYYPSRYIFYLQASKNLYLLNSNFDKLNENAKEVAKIYSKMLKTNGTQFILNTAQVRYNGDLYWEDFLGIYANKSYHEDATFTTVLSLSTLINTWTTAKLDKKGNVRLYFDPKTPKNVTDTIEKGMKTVTKFGFFQNSNLNPFYSITLKTYTSQFYYPMNVHRYLNGTQFNPHIGNQDLVNQIVAVDGIIDSDEYDQLLKQKWFSHNTQEDFTGFNVPRQQFALWSSDSITISFGMSLLSKYHCIDRSSLNQSN